MLTLTLSMTCIRPLQGRLVEHARFTDYSHMLLKSDS